MARRAAYLNRIRNEFSGTPVLHLDTGAFTSFNRDEAELRAQITFASLVLMDTAAVNVAARDIRILGPALEELAEQSRITLISANILDKTSGEPKFKPYVITSVGDLNIAIVGVTEDRAVGVLPNAADSFTIADPEETAVQYLKEVRDKADVVVLMAYMQYRVLESLAEKFSDADIILGADGYTTTWSDQVLAGKPVSYAGNQGKRLMLLKSVLKNKRVNSTTQQTVSLKMSFPQDSKVKTLVDEAHRKLNKSTESSSSELDRLKSIVNDQYVSYTGCRDCHAREYDAWKKTKHYTAFNPLISARKTTNGSCLLCHTTGYRDYGFVDIRVTPGMVHVQCEACHGPGAAHAKNPAEPMKKVDESTCVVCHDAQNSPNFDYELYAARIKH